MVELESARFRSNPAYELRAWNQLGAQAAVLPSSVGSGRPFGALVPRNGARVPARAVPSDIALLFLALKEPGPLPDGVLSGATAEIRRCLECLLLDEVLELATEEGFLTGASACKHLGLELSLSGGNRLSRLSRRGLEYAAALQIGDVSQLAHKLY